MKYIIVLTTLLCAIKSFTSHSSYEEDREDRNLVSIAQNCQKYRKYLADNSLKANSILLQREKDQEDPYLRSVRVNEGPLKDAMAGIEKGRSYYQEHLFNLVRHKKRLVDNGIHHTQAYTAYQDDPIGYSRKKEYVKMGIVPVYKFFTEDDTEWFSDYIDSVIAVYGERDISYMRAGIDGKINKYIRETTVYDWELTRDNLFPEAPIPASMEDLRSEILNLESQLAVEKRMRERAVEGLTAEAMSQKKRADEYLASIESLRAQLSQANKDLVFKSR